MVWHAGRMQPLPDGVLEVKFGAVPCPFGICCIADTPHGICHVSLAQESETNTAQDEILQLWPGAKIAVDHAHVAALAERIFQKPLSTMWSTPLLLAGSAFQISVWRALMEIPAGHSLSYHELAAAIGRPRAARAVGTAIGANHIAVLIPCHRVRRADGDIGGYRWGTTRKAALLAWEARI
jgi:O-6-methylguanine DNA methyltransferase